ncbi:hypothetical protein MWH28_05530 [Natroniella sulfidigena]|uniref:hypothetical protein n=1 Tax=Natroniella sulfidigena TaxID=723921 RepID=UPI00200A7BBF|nr:hypothetical protein [Natroniella sulfidigena]MCK8816832.1 hypothetical protein [Natroniella sulfidigena]
MCFKPSKKNLSVLLIGVLVFLGGAYYLGTSETGNDELNTNNVSAAEEVEDEYLPEDVTEAEVVEEDWSRSSNQAGVTIGAFLSNPEQAEEGLEFEVYMDTHSGNLLDLEIEEVTEVTTDNGVAEGVSWEWVQEDSHHPSGKLEVSNETEKGQLLIDDNTTFIELRFKEINGAEHQFEWGLE